MKKTLIIILFLTSVFWNCLSNPIYTGQSHSDSNSEHTFEVGNFSIPQDTELLESTDFKNDGITYMLEQRYRLPSGQIMYAYYGVEGSNNLTMQKIEETPLLALGTDVNIPGMPGYREFNFGNDRRKLVQFMKLFKLGQRDYSGKIKAPSLSDHVFRSVGDWESDFKLLLDLLDETWVLEYRQYTDYSGLVSTDTTAIFHTSRYSE